MGRASYVSEVSNACPYMCHRLIRVRVARQVEEGRIRRREVRPAIFPNLEHEEPTNSEGLFVVSSFKRSLDQP